MILNITRANKCPRDCPHYWNEGNDHYAEFCSLPDGDYVLKIRNGDLVKCPLGKWTKGD